MDFVSARWADEGESAVAAILADGAAVFIPADERNGDYVALVASGVAIAPYQRWPDLAAAKTDLKRAVSAAADARIQALTDDGVMEPARRQRQLLMRAVAITDKRARGETLTAEEQQAEAIARAVEAAALGVGVAEAVKWAEIDALADLAAAESFDVEAGWP